MRMRVPIVHLFISCTISHFLYSCPGLQLPQIVNWSHIWNKTMTVKTQSDIKKTQQWYLLIKSAGVKSSSRRRGVIFSLDEKPDLMRKMLAAIRCTTSTRRFLDELNSTQTLCEVADLLNQLSTSPSEFAPAHINQRVKEIENRQAARDAKHATEACKGFAPLLSNEKLYGKGIQSMQC